MRIDSECDYCDSLKTEVVCNVCGKAFDTWDKQENFGIHTQVGYGSRFDLSTIDLDLCCECFDKVFGEHILPSCKINPITGEYKLAGEEDTSFDDISLKLAQSMINSPVRTDPDAARKFLSRLSMYDESGQLKKE